MSQSSVVIKDNKRKVNVSDNCLKLMMNPQIVSSTNSHFRIAILVVLTVIFIYILDDIILWRTLFVLISIPFYFYGQQYQSKYNYSARHPVYTLIEKYGWDKFYDHLIEYVNTCSQIKARDDLEHSTGYQIYRFFGDTFPEWNEYNIITRGLILEPSKQKVIASPFIKFFSYHEYDDEIQKEISSLFDKETAENKVEICDKMDGSFGILFYCEYLKQWRIVTQGSFHSEQAKWATNYLHCKCKNHSEHLIKGHTYLMKIICSKYKILINYPFEGLMMLSAYNDKGFEYIYRYLSELCDKINGF